MLVFGRLVENLSLEGVRHELHVNKVTGIVVGIFVSVGVIEIFHELGGRIADGQGDRLVAGEFHLRQSLFQGHVGSVALGRGGQVDGGLRQGNPAFRHPYLGHHLKTGIGQQQGIGIGQSHVFGCAQAKATGNEKRVFATVNHPGQVVDGRIGIASPDALDKGRYDVIVHLTVLVIDGHVFLDGRGDRLVVNHNRGLTGLGIHHQLQYVEQFAGIASAVTHEGVGLLQFYLPLLQQDIFFQGPVYENLQIGLFERLENENLAA